MSIRFCFECGNQIPSLRIHLVPTATRCINCQAEYEKTHDTRVSIYHIEAQQQAAVKPRTLLIANPGSFRNCKVRKRNLQKCPHCSSFVRKSKLQRHIDQVHPVIPKPSPVVKTVEPPTIKDSQLNNEVVSQKSLEKCPHCNSLVRTDRLQRHIDKVHPTTPHQSPIAKPVVQPKSLMRKDPRPLATKQSSTGYSGSAVVDEPMDGSGGWHTFRDQGRFGSHPMFDSMDDESMP